MHSADWNSHLSPKECGAWHPTGPLASRIAAILDGSMWTMSGHGALQRHGSHQGIVAQVTLNIGANSGQGDEGAGMRINT
jgi:hypothetical protein